MGVYYYAGLCLDRIEIPLWRAHLLAVCTAAQVRVNTLSEIENDKVKIRVESKPA